MQLKGSIIACYRNELTGLETPVHRQDNLHLYESADIMAQLLAGNMDYRISHMYFEYQNTNSSVSVSPTIARGDGRLSFDEITGDGPEYRDWLRIPINTSARVSKLPNTSDSVYSSNAVTFNTTSAYSDTKLGESPAHNYYASSGANGPSKVFAVALVAAPSLVDSKQDKIFSRVSLTTPITLQPGNQISIYWLQKFN